MPVSVQRLETSIFVLRPCAVAGHRAVLQSLEAARGVLLGAEQVISASRCSTTNGASGSALPPLDAISGASLPWPPMGHPHRSCISPSDGREPRTVDHACLLPFHPSVTAGAQSRAAGPSRLSGAVWRASARVSYGHRSRLGGLGPRSQDTGLGVFSRSPTLGMAIGRSEVSVGLAPK
jgi:hypothetical protein